ncbi:hypothetical protein [Sphingomonas immobilis]|uniref:DUF4440 domain-containing protein n=1 Tax=Sphingomonas immobilis TaxID=3063997 RepID=A0ABT8ZWU3_9SPHN|nr:hypothetical protein [Sphingomonas sp. CA1-15]MDO7841609.1 hypothetical protein [Sphingomonas sp. CA1-15]
MSAVDAERAFAADAQKIGQWSAFRKWAAEDATMFAPQPVKAQAYLKDKKDPAKALEWWPTASYVSCDGSLAVNTGGWKAPGGAVGYFSTVWQRQKDGGWKWIVDGGDDLKVARRRALKVSRASCEGKAEIDMGGFVLRGDGSDDFGHAEDQSLLYRWTVEKDGSRSFFASAWTGRRWQVVIDNRIAPPK